MCYAGCRYEHTSGEACGECRLGDGDRIPRDAMCRIDDLSIDHDRLKGENIQLVQLLHDLAPDVFIACEMCDLGSDVGRCTNRDCRFRRYYERMVALGVEVRDNLGQPTLSEISAKLCDDLGVEVRDE